MSEKFKKAIDDFGRNYLDELLQQLSEKQRTFFWQIFSKGVSSDHLHRAIDLVERTIKKNIADPERLK